MNSIIKTEDLTKRYGKILALNQVDLEVYEGEVFGLLGPNGVGKTTMIRVLTGQTRLTAGQAIVAGYDIIQEAVKAKARIGVVPEISNLYDEMSAWDNLIFAAQLYSVPKIEREKRAKSLLELFGLYERLKDPVGNFSRGMKRRLTIAAALIHQPQILFLDEPTTGLDVQSTRLIRNLIKELNETGTTIFLTTHYIEEADQLCQRVAIINQGQIVRIDTPEKLKAAVDDQHIIEVSFQPIRDVKEGLNRVKHISRVSRIGDKYRILVEDASEVIPLLTDFARENELKIISLNTRTPSLEDAFIKITHLDLDDMVTEKEALQRGKRNLG